MMIAKSLRILVTSFLVSLALGGATGDGVCHLHSTNTFKVDCHPEPGASESECHSRGCCWLIDGGSANQQPPYVGEPSCFFPADFNCYQVKRTKPASPEGEDRMQQLHLRQQDQRRDYSLNDGARRGYESLGLQRTTDNSIRWLLVRKPNCQRSGFADDAQEIEVDVSVHGDSIINIKISEPDRRRFEPRLPEIKLPTSTRSLNSRSNNLNVAASADGDDEEHGKKLRIGHLVVQLEPPAASSNSTQQYNNSELPSAAAAAAPSVLKVIHQPSGAILFETDFGKLIYSRQFIQFPTYLASPFVYGLGQHLGESLLKSSGAHYAKAYTMFNYGHPPRPDGRTAYSTYPFYINLAQLRHSPTNDTREPNSSKDGESFETKRKLMASGGLMLNSNAMDVLVHSRIDDPSARAGITWRLMGGIVDLYLFSGPRPHDVVEQYQSLVGRPQLPPAWALGYHQSRFNYRDLLAIKLAWAKTRSAGIPMESIWTDLEFMWRTTSYTLNNNELSDLVRTMQKDFDMHYVPIVDPAISIREDPASYEALKLAESMDLFAYYPPQGGIGESSTAVVTTWTDSKQSGVLDFTHPRIVNYLTQVLADYGNKLSFDGIWLDMNEPEVFANEPNREGQTCSSDDRLQYLPGNRELHDRTLCMAAEFRAGKHYDLHNLYAFYQSKAHYEALKILNSTRRPLVISRSQFVGQGKYSGSWLGDLASVFYHLKWSLIGTIESSWFGQPLTGADICGFFGSTTDELCARWFSLGAFYPFARNHNEGSTRDQDPGSLDETVQRAARVGMVRRYSLLPYLYTLFYQNHRTGEPVVRSVLFEFFDKYHLDLELKDLPQIDDQFMWGPALMIAPVLDPDTNFRSVYLPPGRWYDLSIGLPGSNMEQGYDAFTSNWPLDDAQGLDESALKRKGSLRKSIECPESTGCWLRDQYTPVGAINVYLRGGQIIPTFKRVDHEKSINQAWTDASFFLEIGLDTKDEAFGTLFWDSGESDSDSELYNQAYFWLTHNRLMVNAVETKFEKSLKFSGFIVHGAKLSEDQIPKPSMYRDSKLLYTYDKSTESLRCEFVSPDNERAKPLSVGKYDKLVFKW